MKKSNLIFVLRLFAIVIIGCSITTYLLGSPTFTVSENSYYGKVSPIKKLTIGITPTANEPNIGGSSDAIYAELLRLSYAVSGSDDAFTILLTDETGRTIFSKADCSESASFMLEQSSNTDVNYPRIPVAGPLTINVSALGKAEIQSLHVISDNNDVNGGTFRIFLNDINTGSLAYDCNAAVLEAALEDMNNIDDVTVTGSGIAGPNDPNTFTVTFAGNWYGDDVNGLSIDCNSLTTTDPGSTLNGVETESVKGAYGITGVTLTVYYRDDRY